MKSIIKFSVGGLILVGIGWGALSIIQHMRERQTPEYQTRQTEKTTAPVAASQAHEDTIGGSTPDETLAMFVAALKKGDIDLASRFFVTDSQDEWRSDLQVMKEKGLVQNMISDLGNIKLDKNDNTVASYSINTEDGQIIQVVVIKSASGKWKIKEM